MLSTVFTLNPDLYIQELDTSFSEKKFYIEVNQSNQFEISESLYVLLELIDGQRTVSEITEIYNKKYFKNYDPRDIYNLIKNQLLSRGIVFESGKEPSWEIYQKKSSYIHFKKSLIKTEFLGNITNKTSKLYRPAIFPVFLLLSIALQIIYYMFVMKPAYITLDFLFSKQIVVFYLGVNISTLLHEIGHASAMKSRKLEHGVIGVGIYLFMLVFYTNVSKVWRLKRRDRIVVNLGGIYFELLWSSILLGIYLIFKNTIFLLIIFFIHMRIIWNLIPFFRTDGYWIFSDLMGVTNLRKISSSILFILGKKLVDRNTVLPGEYLAYPVSRRMMILVYALISNTFFIFVGYWLFKYSKEIVVNFKTEILSPIQNILLLDEFNYMYLAVFLKILSKLMLLIFVGYYFFRFFSEGYQKLKGIFFNGQVS